MILLRLITVLFFSASQGATYTSVEQIPNPTRQGSFIANPDQILTPVQVAELQSLIVRHQEKKDNEIAVVVLSRIAEISPKELAHQLFNHWGVGKRGKDNGLLILVSYFDHRVEFETGYGLEGVLPDILCKRIQMEEMIPLFRKGQTFEALRDGLKATIQILVPRQISFSLLSDCFPKSKAFSGL